MLKRDLHVGQRVYLTRRRGQPRYEAYIVDLSGQWANPASHDGDIESPPRRVVKDHIRGRVLIVVAIAYGYSRWVPYAVGPSKVHDLVGKIDEEERFVQIRDAQEHTEGMRRLAVQKRRYMDILRTLSGLIQIGRESTSTSLALEVPRYGARTHIDLSLDQFEAVLNNVPPETRAAAALAMLGTEVEEPQ